MKKYIIPLIAVVGVAVVAVLGWLLVQSKNAHEAVRYNINPKTYALDTGIEIRRWDGKGGDSHSKPPVVVVHGGAADASQWSKVAPKIAESGRTVFAFSGYNHGLSKKLPDDVFARRSMLDTARVELPAVVDHALDVTGHKQIDLIGRSMGGAVSLSFAANNPDIVRRLAVMSPVVPSEFASEVIPIPVDAFKPSSPGDAEQQRQLFEPTAPEDVAYQHWMEGGLESPVAIWEATRWTLDINVRDIKAKSLVITADPKFDRITPPANIIKMAEAMGARHHTVEGIGHSEMMYLDPHWRNISTMLSDFLDES